MNPVPPEIRELIDVPEGAELQPLVWEGHLQFNIVQPRGYGATFYVPLEGITTEAIARAFATKVAQFSVQPLPPVFQQAPRKFAAPEINHY